MVNDDRPRLETLLTTEYADAPRLFWQNAKADAYNADRIALLAVKTGRPIVHMQARTTRTTIGKITKKYTKLPHKEGSTSEDWIVLSSQTEEDTDMAVLMDVYGSVSYEVVDRYFDRMGWLQQLSTNNGTILVIYKSRIALYKSRFYETQ